jgi:hypothetical protein
MLRSVSSVTFSVDRFDASTFALESALGYCCVQQGNVSPEQAAFWSAPDVAGNRFAVFAPDSGEHVTLRLIESDATPGYAPLRTFGWNAAELHVADVHELARRLHDSPFEILGGPRDLLNNGSVVALQARGPSDEVLYLTQVNGEIMQRSYGKTESAVGRVFIVVLGCSDMDATRGFYSKLTRATPRPRKFAIRVLAAAHGLDPMTTKFPIASAVLKKQFRIELDGYPDTATSRPVTPGHLPPGLAIVSFDVASLDEVEGAIAQTVDSRRAAMLRGPDGELLELTEASD